MYKILSLKLNLEEKDGPFRPPKRTNNPLMHAIAAGAAPPPYAQALGGVKLCVPTTYLKAPMIQPQYGNGLILKFHQKIESAPDSHGGRYPILVVVHPDDQNHLKNHSYPFHPESGMKIHLAHRIQPDSDLEIYQAYVENFASNQKIAAVAVLTPAYQIPKTIFTHPKEFGHIATVKVSDSSYLIVTRQGIPFDHALKAIGKCPKPDGKFLFTVHYLNLVIDKLVLIEAAGYSHQDIKPENIVIFAKEQAAPIDMRSLPEIGSYRNYGRTLGYRASNLTITKEALSASGVHDVFSVAKILENCLPLIGESDFVKTQLAAAEINSITGSVNPTVSLTDLKTRFDTILQNASTEAIADFKSIETWFFPTP